MAALLALALAALGAAAGEAARLAPPTSHDCAGINTRAPCGQRSDSQAACEAKGCCYNAANATLYPCFYGGASGVPITSVHVIQANHFDAGYTGTTTAVLNSYFTSAFPAAAALGKALDARGGNERLHWMTQPWIVDLFLNCPPNAGLSCPTPAAVATFTAAVAAGHITWHAFPFNGEMELGDASLVTFGVVNVTHALDDRFGVPHKGVLSQRDVPGLSRAALPVLHAAGITALSIGANGNSAPAVVPRAFLWSDAASGVRMPVLFHPGGYGSIAAEEVVVLPGSPHACVYSWRGDNSGPPASVAEVVADWASVAALFPGATVFASTLDNFTETLSPSVLAALPVLTAEMGDTWVFGAAADPQKSAWTKLVRDARSACLAAGECVASDPALGNFTRLFLKNMEHTFGIDTKSLPGDWAHWSNRDVAALLARNSSAWVRAVDTWAEQRRFGFEWPLAALPAGHPLATRVKAAMDSVYPPPPPSPAADGWSAANASSAQYRGSRFSVSFSGATGSVAALTDAATGVTWSGQGAGMLAELQYWTFNETDYDVFAKEYRFVAKWARAVGHSTTRDCPYSPCAFVCVL